MPAKENERNENADQSEARDQKVSDSKVNEELIDYSREEKIEIFPVTDEEYERLKPYFDEAKASGYTSNFSIEEFLKKAHKKYELKKN